MVSDRPRVVTPVSPGESLDAVLRAMSTDAAAGDACLVCDGETIRVQRRSGAAAFVCRECGTSLADEAPGGTTVARCPVEAPVTRRVA